MKKTKYILIFILFSGCIEVYQKYEIDTIENVIFVKECEGIFEYSIKDGKSKKLFPTNEEDILIENPFKYSNSRIQFGIRDKSKEIDSISFYVNFHSLNGKHVSTKKFIEIENYTVLVENKNLETNQIKIDTLKNCTGSSSSLKYVKYNCQENFFERFYSEAISKKGEKVFSRKGDIYLISNDNTETKIMDFEGEFDAKFGNGFYQPKFILNEEKVLFRKLSGFLGGDKPSLYIYDRKEKVCEIFTEGRFRNIKISNNGKYMLFSRTKKISLHSSSNCRNEDLFIMNLKTKKYKKIGEGNHFEWKKENYRQQWLKRS